MKHERKLRNKLAKFLADDTRRSQWITTPELSVYVRRAFHGDGTPGHGVKTLDLASINVPVLLQGKGICTRLIEIAQEMTPSGNVYVENVQNSRLEIHLCKLQAADPRWKELTHKNSGVQGCWIWCNQVQKEHVA